LKYYSFFDGDSLFESLPNETNFETKGLLSINRYLKDIMSPVKSIQGNQAIKTIQWVSWADNEYIAARQLLLADLLVQGSSLSNTTIEKYLKALFMLLGMKNPRIHNIDKLYENLK
jgi:hypothetical protein